MRAMDEHFVRIDLPIAARAMAAMAEAGFDQGLEVVRVPTRSEPVDGKYDGEDLLLHAERWFTKRYPAQSRIDMSLGETVVLLHGQLWRYRVPFSVGPRILHAGNQENGPATLATPTGYPLLPPGHALRRMLPAFNLVGGVDGLPAQIAENLTDGEQAAVLRAYCSGQLAYFWLTRSRKHEFIRQAIGEFASSVHHLLVSPPQTGLARWAVLQAVEKVFKSFLHHAGRDFPRRGPKAHDPIELARLVREAGGPVLSESSLRQVKCTAAVRYGAEASTVADALRAHEAALDLVKDVAAELCNRYPLADTPRFGDELAAARDIVQLLGERTGLDRGTQ